MELKVWQIHPKASRIEKSEKTLKGHANKAAIKWCGPYTNANEFGFWLYPPVNLDFIYKDGKIKIENMEQYGDEDYHIVKNLIKKEDQSEIEKWIFPGIGRTKTTCSLVEPNVLQLWTGLIFQTPPGWCLEIRSPINFPYSGYSVMEAILETDWMQYDIWLNIECHKENELIEIRKEKPIASLLPLRRESFKEDWSSTVSNINRSTKESNDVFEYWISYNKQKFEYGGKQQLTETLTKDSTTYFKERNRLLGKQMEPYQDVSKCPFLSQIQQQPQQQEIKQENKCPFHQPKELPIYEEINNNFLGFRFGKKN